MKEIVIRKENYGVLVFNPDKQSYYRIYDEYLKNIILDGAIKNNFQLLKEKYNKEYYDLGFDKYQVRYIDNTVYGDIFIPLEAYFDYTAKCNKNCAYCYNKKFLGNTTMKPDIVRKIFDDFYKLGIMRIHLAGGEPTIDYYGLKNYIEYGRSLGMVLSMATNGTCLTDRVCDLLTKNDLFSVSISLDSCDEEINDQTRGEGSYKQALKGLKNLYLFKQKNNSDLKICFKPVYYPNLTKDDVQKLIDFSLKNDIDILKFANPERCEEHECGYYGSIKKDYYKTIKLIQSVINDNKNKNIKVTNASNPSLYDFVIGIEENKGCIGAQELITINPDGRITPCLMNHTYLGNIYDYSDILDYLLHSKKLNDYLKKISNYDCSNCNIHPACRGGCQVRKKVEYGEIKNTDPFCPKEHVDHNIEIKKLVMRKINVFHSL